MKAARLEDGTLHIRDLPVPVPGDEEALVRISASGVCHSDLHIARGDWAGLPRSGSIGHEAIGVVEALGPGAERFAQVGDRVILGLGGAGGGYWCGACEYCLRGQPRHCTRDEAHHGHVRRVLLRVGARRSCRCPTASATRTRRSRAAGSPRTAR